MIRTLVVALFLVGSAARADDRGYTLYVPPAAKHPAPLVVVLHCLGCTPEQVTERLGLRALADGEGVMLALPYGRVGPRGPFWNATDACCNFQGVATDDVGYVAGVIDDAVARGADRRRVYLVGISNGGFLAHRIACDKPALVAAFVSIAGAGWLDPARCKTTAPVAALEIHGDADALVPYGGGKGIPSARQSVERWTKIDGCSPSSTATDVDLVPALAGAETHVERWKCARAAVELWTIRGGEHVSRFGSDVAARLWQFVAPHHR